MAEEVWYEVVVPGIVEGVKPNQSITVCVPENVNHRVVQRNEFPLVIKTLAPKTGQAAIVRGFVHIHPTRPTTLTVDVPFSTPKIYVKSIPKVARLPDSWKPVAEKRRGSPPWATTSREPAAATSAGPVAATSPEPAAATSPEPAAASSPKPEMATSPTPKARTS